jgi:hypothetical protein
MNADTLHLLDGFAGLAALVNSAILWPMYRTLKAMVVDSHEPRITALEQTRARQPKRAARPKRSR